MTVLPAGLEHDTVMDQKTPYDSAILHLLPQVASPLTLECVNLPSVVLPVTAMQRFSLRGVSETGSDDRIRRLPNIRAKRCEDVKVAPGAMAGRAESAVAGSPTRYARSFAA